MAPSVCKNCSRAFELQQACGDSDCKMKNSQLHYVRLHDSECVKWKQSSKCSWSMTLELQIICNHMNCFYCGKEGQNANWFVPQPSYCFFTINHFCREVFTAIKINLHSTLGHFSSLECSRRWYALSLSRILHRLRWIFRRWSTACRPEAGRKTRRARPKKLYLNLWVEP